MEISFYKPSFSMTSPSHLTLRDYDLHVYWDERDEFFVAEVPEIPSCAADGLTQAAAVANLAETFAVLKEAYAEEGLMLPKPDPELPISIRKLAKLAEVVKISKLADLAGIPGQTLATKIRRGTEFKSSESRRLARALREHGLSIH